MLVDGEGRAIVPQESRAGQDGADKSRNPSILVREHDGKDGLALVAGTDMIAADIGTLRELQWRMTH